MNPKLNDVIEAVSSALSSESAYAMADTCNKYALGDGSNYASPSSKQKFLKGLILNLTEQTIIDLAKRVMNDYDSDAVSLALNHYFDGKFFKLSMVTRRALLQELFALGPLNNMLDVEAFLDAARLSRFLPPPGLDFVNALVYGSNYTTRDKTDLRTALLCNKVEEIRDERFFSLLEQTIHPYNRPNSLAAPYITIIGKHLKKDGLELSPAWDISGEVVYRVTELSGVQDKIKNLIFASDSYKPEIVIDDALSNRIRIVRHAEHCLVYDRPIPAGGLLWVELVDWWCSNQGTLRSLEAAVALKSRLSVSSL